MSNNHDSIKPGTPGTNENPPRSGGSETGHPGSAKGKRTSTKGSKSAKKGNGAGNGHAEHFAIPLATDDPHSYTVLRAVSPKEALLTKVFTKDRKWISYGGQKGDRPGAYLHSARTVDIVSLDALEAELRLLDKEPRCCFVAGAIVDGSDRENMRRIKYEHKRKDAKTGETVIDKPTLRDVARFLIPLDVDSLPCPDGIDPKDLTAAATYIRSQLPLVFRNVACVAQATSGHCLKGGLRSRMFFMSDRPLTSAEIKTWLTHEKAPVDFSIYGANAVVYTATCVFEDSSHDPLPNGRIVRLDGDDSVTAPSADELAAMKPARKTHKGEKVVCPPEWKEVEKALNAIPNDGEGQVYDIWLFIGMALQWAQHHRNMQTGESDNAGFDLWDQWSGASDKYDPAMLEMKWDSFDPERGGENGPITVDYIFGLARKCGWKGTEVDDATIRARIGELYQKAQEIGDELSDEYKALKNEAIALFAKSSRDYRGNPKERRQFCKHWGMNADTLADCLKEENDKRRQTQRPNGKPILIREEHFQNAEEFAKIRHSRDGQMTLLHHQRMFYSWETTHYAEIPEEQLRSNVWKFLASAMTPTEEGELVPFNPNKIGVANVNEALAAQAQLYGDITFPYWEGEALAPAREILSCANGLLHLPTRKLFPHTPRLRNVFALDYAHEPDAPIPEQWLKFLKQLWPDDQESIDTLQEIFGYALTSDLSQQKIFMLIGPKRGGKGTIARVLSAMLGEVNVAGPTLASLSREFGLQPLINKPLAIIADARIGGKTDVQVIVERLLSISGEDRLDVPRKFLPVWCGQLPTRFMILTNVLPKLGDVSGALVSRFVVLKLEQSFYGKEDHGLFDKLRVELPSILNWSLDGLSRLRKRGHFLTPKAAKETLVTFESLSNPVGAFLEEECKLGEGEKTPCNELFMAWEKWCERQGRDFKGTAQTFGAELHAAVPKLKTTQVREGEKRVRYYVGVGLLL